MKGHHIQQTTKKILTKIFAKKTIEKNVGKANSKYSLRLRLLYFVIGMNALFWIISLTAVITTSWSETNDVFDDALKESAKLLLRSHTQLSSFTLKPSIETAGVLKPDADADADADADLDSDDLYYQIIFNNKVISRTEKSPLLPFVSHFPSHKGFKEISFHGESWRIYILKDLQTGIEVQVGQSLEKRNDILETLAENLIIPAILLLLILAIISGFTIYYLLRPLNQIASLVSQKSPHDLSVLHINTQSIELTTIIFSLNSLFSRLNNTIQNERRFTADAAHELRTPLAGLSMQAQLLTRKYPEMQKGLQKFHNDIERLTHLIEHLLTLARIDPAVNLPYQPILIPDLFTFLNDLFQSSAKNKNIHLLFKTNANANTNTITLQANLEMINILLKNLIDNALKYCPIGSTVEVIAELINQRVKLTIRDNGLGVDESQISQLINRFFRVAGSEQIGSGLGLSIVQRITDIHQAQLVIKKTDVNSSEGLTIEITFP